jgi:hypothetical protein
MKHLKMTLVAVVAAVLAISTRASAQPEPSPSPAPASPGAPAPDASTGLDLSKLTPEQREALQLAIVKISQNPVGNITVLPFQNNFNYGYGPYTRLQYNLNVQPVAPFMLSPTLSLVARTIFPIVNQPSALPPGACITPTGCPSTLGIGDTQEQLFFGPKTKPGALIWAVGPIFQFPTGSPSTLTSGKWAAGPDAVVLVMPGKWVMGALVTQLWSFAGPATTGRNVNAFLLQPFVNYNLKHGWALSTAPIVTANWAAAQNKWAVPIGGGIANTFKDGDQLMQLSVQYYTWVTRPLASPQTDLKITWSLLWPVKRGINVEELLKEAQ